MNETSAKKKKVNWLRSLLSHEEDHSAENLRLLRLYEYALEELRDKLRNFQISFRVFEKTFINSITQLNKKLLCDGASLISIERMSAEKKKLGEKMFENQYFD